VTNLPVYNLALVNTLEMDQKVPYHQVPLYFHFTLFTGKLVGGFCALCGTFILTLPIPIVVNSFSQTYNNRVWRNQVAEKKRQQAKAMLVQ
jgi:hypothetical protein